MSVTETFGNADVPESVEATPAALPADAAPAEAAPAAPEMVEPVKAPENLIAEGKVEHISMDKLDLDDETFRFRENLRVGPLMKSIQSEGQQLPIVVRKIGKTRGQKFQIISGFRRATAMKKLGYTTIAAIVRDDLDSDEAAFRASVVENEARKTYSDIDRALVIRAHQTAGYTSVEVGALMGISQRQANNLRGLLDLPQNVQDAIDDPEAKFSATHGLVLKQMMAKYPNLDAAMWVEVVKTEDLSVAQLKKAINKDHKATGRPALGSIFNMKATDAGAGVFRLSPVRVVVADLAAGEKYALRMELNALLKALG